MVPYTASGLLAASDCDRASRTSGRVTDVDLKRMPGHVEDPRDPSDALPVMAETTGTAISGGTVERYPLSNYSPTTYRDRPVRTRMPGGVGAGS